MIFYEILRDGNFMSVIITYARERYRERKKIIERDDIFTKFSGMEILCL